MAKAKTATKKTTAKPVAKKTVAKRSPRSLPKQTAAPFFDTPAKTGSYRIRNAEQSTRRVKVDTEMKSSSSDVVILVLVVFVPLLIAFLLGAWIF